MSIFNHKDTAIPGQPVSMNQKLRSQFPMLQQGIYADTAASGLLYDQLLEWRQEHDLDFLLGGSTMKTESFGILDSLRATLASFFNTGSGRIALTPNFSLGLNMLLDGLEPQQQVLLLQNDYPSLNQPFESRGYQLTYVNPTPHLEQQILDCLAKGHFTIFAFSVVQWLNGIRLSSAFIRRLKTEYPGLLLLADGTQFCGAFAFDFQASGLDVLGCSGYKWLLGGYGNGFFLFSEEAKTRFNLKGRGYQASGGEPGSIPEFPRQLEPGHLDSFNFGSLNFSLQHLSSLGMQAIEAQNLNLQSRALQGFHRLGLLDESVVHRPQHGNIFNLAAQAGLFDALKANGVVASERGGGIRLSFHWYNTENEVDTILNLLEEFTLS